jgi:uncharacterized protein YlxW (UPF0749 family)
MNLWTFLLVVSIAGMIFSAWRTKHFARHGVFEEHGKVRQLDTGERETALQREVEDLRERIKVLERIATDDRGASRLSAEIDALRATTKLEEGSKQ